MENKLDNIANGKLEWHTLCSNCYESLKNATNILTNVNKFNIEIDNYHSLIIGKHGPVIKCIDPTDSKKISFLPVKKDLDLENMSNITLEDVIDNVADKKSNLINSIGKYKGQDLFIKKGKYGIYAEWGKETKALKDECNIENIKYIDVIRYLDKDTILDPSKPVGLIRELNNHLSIRTGKYGDYIFYKKSHTKKPEFYKLKGFDTNYKNCDKALLLNWIKQTYNIE